MTQSQRQYAQRVAAGICGCCGKSRATEGKTTCLPCRRRNQETYQRFYAWARETVLDFYGRVCARCGHDGSRSRLDIDHIDESGYVKRRTLSSHYNLTYWLIKHNLPTGYQTLCHRCNILKAHDFGRATLTNS